MQQAQPKPQVAESPYFVNAWVDMFMVGGAAILAWGLLRLFPHLAQPRVVFALVVAFNWPHFFCTLERLYREPETRRNNPWSAYWFPLVCLAAMFAAAGFPTTVGVALVATFAAWKVWHFAAQNLGVTRIYAGRCGFIFGRSESMALTTFIYATFAVGLLMYLPMLIPGETRFGLAFPPAVISAAKVVMYVSGAVLFYQVFRFWRRTGVMLTFPFLVPLAAQVVMMLKGPPTQFLVVAGVFHGLQYMYVCWIFRYRRLPDEEKNNPDHTPMFTMKWTFQMFMGGLAFYGLILLLSRSFLAMGLASVTLANLIAVSGTNIHHFFADGVLWKLRKRGAKTPNQVFFNPKRLAA